MEKVLPWLQGGGLAPFAAAVLPSTGAQTPWGREQKPPTRKIFRAPAPTAYCFCRNYDNSSFSFQAILPLNELAWLLNVQFWPDLSHFQAWNLNFAASPKKQDVAVNCTLIVESGSKVTCFQDHAVMDILLSTGNVTYNLHRFSIRKQSWIHIRKATGSQMFLYTSSAIYRACILTHCSYRCDYFTYGLYIPETLAGHSIL